MVSEWLTERGFGATNVFPHPWDFLLVVYEVLALDLGSPVWLAEGESGSTRFLWYNWRGTPLLALESLGVNNQSNKDNIIQFNIWISVIPMHTLNSVQVSAYPGDFQSP
jgi:hypothetical protein